MGEELDEFRTFNVTISQSNGEGVIILICGVIAVIVIGGVG